MFATFDFPLPQDTLARPLGSFNLTTTRHHSQCQPLIPQHLNARSEELLRRPPTERSESKEQDSTRVPQGCVPQDPLGIGVPPAGGTPAPDLNVVQG